MNMPKNTLVRATCKIENTHGTGACEFFGFWQRDEAGIASLAPAEYYWTEATSIAEFPKSHVVMTTTD